ncbi:MAG: acyltransferase family protein [Pseudobutyrivibrio sp.]|nr:acyltransferase family protein [Pseudobutyrivibrio sp.]
MKSRLKYIDLMECIGMLFVIIYHCDTYEFSFTDGGAWYYSLRYFLRTVLASCVPLFFFANGYLLLNHDLKLEKHIKKTISLAALTIIWSVITTVVLMPIKGEMLSVSDIIRYALTLRAGWTSHLWFMGALVCIYIFFPLLKSTFDFNRNAFVYFTVAVFILTIGNELMNNLLTLAYGLLGLGAPVGHNFFMSFNPFREIKGYSFFYFCLGGLAHGRVEKINSIAVKKRVLLSSAVLLISCGISYIYNAIVSHAIGVTSDVVVAMYGSLTTVFMVLAIYALCLCVSIRDNSVIVAISKRTLGIYFVHEIYVNLIKRYASDLPGYDTFTGCIVVAVIVLTLSLITVLAVEKVPVVRRLLEL